MTSKEIREQVTPMVIWMADAAIRESRRAITQKQNPTCVYDRNKVGTYNYPELDIAAEVLFNMFSGCVADMKIALIKMPEECNGVYDSLGHNHFDDFVDSLSKIVGTVKLREADWVLDKK